MSDQVMTLDGLGAASVPSSGKCGELVSIHAPVLGQDIQVCQKDIQRLAGAGVDVTLKGVGRPKGSTRKRGAAKPKVRRCNKYKVVKNKRGRKVCKCNSPGNSQIQANSKCDLPSR